MNIAVLGSGNGGSALACEWALKGHEVHIVDFERFPSMIRAIQKTGYISSQGQIEGNGRIKYAGFDFGKAIENAELIFAVGPAYSTEPFAEACRPHLRKGQIYVVCPTSCLGSLAFKRGLGLRLEDNSVIVAETSTLPYAVRILEPGRIHVYNRLKAGYFVATLPSNLNEQVFNMLVKVHDGIQPAKNVWQT
ncbi:MAG: NAD(P)-binding domain-containing protein, partial [Bacillota bacterium]